jgi:hypothetical protein
MIFSNVCTFCVVTRAETIRSVCFFQILQVTGSWPGSRTESSEPLTLSAGEGAAASLSIKVAASQIRLWWPNGVGMGTQQLYNIR